MSAPRNDAVVIEEHPISEDADLGSIAMVTINRPDKLNALNADVMSGIKAMVEWVESTPHVRVVIITGAQPNAPPEGKRAKPNAFVAGADITEFVGKKATIFE
jgi:enoyl-CoA hydratase